MSFPPDRRPTDGVTAIAIRLDGRTAAPTERHRRAMPRNRLTVGIHELDVATDHKRSAGRHGDARRPVTGGARPTLRWCVHPSMVRVTSPRRETYVHGEPS